MWWDAGAVAFNLLSLRVVFIKKKKWKFWSNTSRAEILAFKAVAGVLILKQIKIKLDETLIDQVFQVL